MFIQNIDDALKENQRLQENSYCVLSGSEFKISLKENTLKFVPQYLIPEKLKRKVMEWVNKWVKKGFVKKWDKDEKNLWNSPLLVVPKKSGGQVDPDDIRVCLDLRAVNALTKDPSNILPSPVELFEHVQDVKYFTEIDLTEAYHHIMVLKKSQPLLGFLALDKNQYVYVRIPFGPKGVVMHFQVQGKQVISVSDEAANYLDNFLVFSKELENHSNEACRVIQKLMRAGFQIKMKKSKFCIKRIQFMGYLIDGFTWEIDSFKKEMAQKMVKPQTRK